MPVESEYTSKTLCPPQLWESGSSCMARKPHSAFPVIGSTGILRRNRTLVGVLEVVEDGLDAAPTCAVLLKLATVEALVPTCEVPPALTVTPVISVSRSGGYPWLPTSMRIKFLSAASLYLSMA